MLFGVALGALIALLVRITFIYQDTGGWAVPELLLGVRGMSRHLIMQVLYAVRTALLFFYLLFILRVLLRNQWAAALAFVLLFAVIDALDSTTPLFEAATTFVYFSMLAVAVLRWGLTTLTVALFVGNLLLNVPATTDFSAWYLSVSTLELAIPLALAALAFYTSIRGRAFAV